MLGNARITIKGGGQGDGKPMKATQSAANLSTKMMSNSDSTTEADCLALLREMLPRATRIALLAQVNHSSSTTQTKAARETARALGVELEVAEARDSRDYDAALGAITKATPGLLILANPTFFDDRQRLATLAVRHRLASLCEWREMAEAGCLMSYGPNISDLYRRVATYLDRILKGAKPGDLPVEQPTKFELVINLKTAKALGLTIPPALLQRADQVIE
jgi:putative ABC transport system substrate-binding protein